MGIEINIFYLDENPVLAAQAHCNKHIVKMCTEYAQLLSTAHRVLDGVQELISYEEGGKKRTKKVLLLLGESAKVVLQAENPRHKLVIENARMYKATHVNHPCSAWARATSANYVFLYCLLVHCLVEYRFRYDRRHAVTGLLSTLVDLPKNLTTGEFHDPPLVMPEEFKAGDAVTSYRNFYNGSKARFAKWTRREPPEWFRNNFLETT